ncbi:MAG TPA: NUDIX hydrolase [Patescibacteria group bacterium]
MARYIDSTGTKIALLHEKKIVVLLRDNIPELPYANMWDLPGGGKEGNETPRQCLAREVNEELGIAVNENSIIWEKLYTEPEDTTLHFSFMVCFINQATIDKIVLGDEGQRWMLMPISKFFEDAQVIGKFKPPLRDFLSQSHYSYV